MATTMLFLAATAPEKGSLRTDPKRRAVSKVWGSMMRYARKYGQEQGFETIHHMPYVVSVTRACENIHLLNHENII